MLVLPNNNYYNKYQMKSGKKKKGEKESGRSSTTRKSKREREIGMMGFGFGLLRYKTNPSRQRNVYTRLYVYIYILLYYDIYTS